MDYLEEEAMMSGDEREPRLARGIDRPIPLLHRLIALSFAMLLSFLFMAGPSPMSAFGLNGYGDVALAADNGTSAITTDNGTAAVTTDNGTTTTPVTSNPTASTSSYSVAVIARATVRYSLSSDGALVVDETAAAKSCANVQALCKTIIDDDSLSLSLSVSPVLLAKWAADTTDDGAVCITTLNEARATGRLELLACGYADPRLDLIALLGFPDDVKAQYSRSADILAGSYSTGTCPAGGALVDDDIDGLLDSGITWCAVDGTSVIAQGQTSTRSVYTSAKAHNLTLLALDSTLSGMFGSPNTDTVLSYLSALRTANPLGEVACMVEIGDLSDNCKALSNVLQHIAKTQNMTLKTAGSLVDASDDGAELPPLAQLSGGKSGTDTSLITTFAKTHDDLATLAQALYSKSDVLQTAQDSYYAAESESPTDEERLSALRFASSQVDKLFSGVHIQVHNMTLAGNSGEIPVQVINDTDAAFEVTIKATGEGIDAGNGYDSGTATVIYSGENYLQIPVSADRQRMTLTIAVEGGGRTIATTDIWVKTSHINEITLVVCAAAIVIASIVIVYRRRRRKAQADTLN